MLFPQPQKIKAYRTFSFGKNVGVILKYCSPKNAEKTYYDIMSDIKTGDDISVQLIEVNTRELTYIEQANRVSSEIYKLLITEASGHIQMQIQFSARRGLVHALFCLKRMISADEYIIGEVLDYPLFERRGFIEGFYGKPWSVSSRTEMLEQMAWFGDNTFYYAPKNDEFHREKWRSLYPADKLLELKKLSERAKTLEVDFFYCIAPGLSIKYSSDSDFFALCEKAKQLFSIGVYNFGLFLDDIPDELFYEEDRALYAETVNAHIDLCKKFYAFLTEANPLANLSVCPMQYCGKGNEYYISRLGSALPNNISIFFTGPDICSREISVQNAQCFLSSVKRKPLYWDNYPVNDAEMYKEMHIAPITGRDKELYLHSDGLISNCMEYFECSKFALITVACYLWNPVDYEPSAAFNAAVNYVLPESEREDFLLLSEHFRTSCLRDENSRIMNKAFSSAVLYRQHGDMIIAAKAVSDYASRVHMAAVRISGRHSPLYNELSEWIKKFCLMSQILDNCVELMSASVFTREHKKTEIKRMLEEYNNNATVLTAFCFREFAETVLDL